ncbi:hypothetical protein ACFV1S_34050 [Streptomyces globisporus]|uniref:hypothetical protein n=1 Tax=Streptomyces TaxID=1883 RepID=UPI001F52371A|nr:hypothetical protein [Streptomyces sp. TSRI0445]
MSELPRQVEPAEAGRVSYAIDSQIFSEVVMHGGDHLDDGSRDCRLHGISLIRNGSFLESRHTVWNGYASEGVSVYRRSRAGQRPKSPLVKQGAGEVLDGLISTPGLERGGQSMVSPSWPGQLIARSPDILTGFDRRQYMTLYSAAHFGSYVPGSSWYAARYWLENVVQ